MHRFAFCSMLSALLLATSLSAQNPEGPPANRFQQNFTLPGIQFNEEQQARIEELRAKYTPQLTELQQRQFRIDSPEQRRARREAVQAAREAGKNPAEQRAAGVAAVTHSEEQLKQLADVQRERNELVAKIQGELRELLTPQQRTQLQRSAGQNSGQRRRPPTHRDVSYGPHERNVMDVWLARSESPSPVLVSIHGGGFRGGNKGVDAALLDGCLDAGISVVAITYRLSGEAIAPAQHQDAARAIQFIRHQAQDWNLDSKRIAATGSSAGAGLSMWLGFHDDMADPNSDDPVRRQSTRLTCISVYNGQSSYDPRFIRDLFPGTDTYLHSALPQLFGADLTKLDELPEEKYRLFEEVSAITHLTPGDPPVLLAYNSEMETPIRNQGIGIHHPKFAQALKEQAEPLEVECRIHTGMRRDDWAGVTLEFVKRHFGME